jgi:ACT domain-containing protein
MDQIITEQQISEQSACMQVGISKSTYVYKATIKPKPMRDSTDSSEKKRKAKPYSQRMTVFLNALSDYDEFH